MEIRDYLESNSKKDVHVVAINWMEDFFGASPERLSSMIEKLHPAIRVVEGTAGIGRDFGDVHSVPAVFIFDGSGREIYRLGGDQGPSGRVHLRGEQIRKVLEALR